MKTVILVGAGATRADAEPKQGIKEAFRPPLDYTFFSQAEKANLAYVSSVKRYMQSEHGIARSEPLGSLEEVFNYIFSDVYSSRRKEKSLETLWRLIQLYNRSIAMSTNDLKGNSTYGVFGLVRKLFHSDPSSNISFITYNHDLMIEKSLARLKEYQKYSGLPLSMEHAYQVDFNDVVGVQGGSKQLPQDEASSIPILKLHGSLNWHFFVRSAHDPENALREPQDEFYCVNQEEIYRNLVGTLQGRTRRTHLIPIVLPPIYEKSSRYSSILAPIRDKAEQELRRAERIVIFGYSFPDTDFMARSLIHRSVRKNEALKEFYIIDKNPQICEKIASLCNLDRFQFATSVPLLSI